MKNLDNEKLNKILMGVIILLQIMTISIVVLCSDCYSKNDKQNSESNNEVSMVEKKEAIEETEENTSLNNLENKIKVDVKGAIKKAGVYELSNDDRVIDAINLAGGLKSNASTKYLNLSKKVSDEMIIYVYTTTQVKNMGIKEEIKTECNCPTVDCNSCAGSNIINSSNTNDNKGNEANENTNNTKPTKISINKANKEQLMTLNGIGESKAEAIIEYRNTKGKFTKLEDIMNVSGIGESAYSKIKDYITL